MNIRWFFTNRTATQTIVKNTFWLFFGQLFGRLLRAAIVIYAARALGAGSWGAFSYALGITAFLTTFSDFGINALITKEASRDPARKIEYLSTALALKLSLFLVFTSLALFLLPFLAAIAETRRILPVLILVFAFDTIRDLGSALARALEKMELEALGVIITNAAIVGFGFFFLSLQKTGVALAWGYAAGSGLGLLLTGYVLRDHLRNLGVVFHRSLLFPILTKAWPFGLLSLMGAINLNTDIIMLGWLRTADEVGYYSAAQKIILLLYVVPTLVASGSFPALAKFARSAPEQARAILERTVAATLFLGIPLAVLGAIFAPWIISLLFGAQYLPSVTAFRILIITVLIVYPATLVGNAIFAYDEQRHFVKFVGVAIVGNVLFNFLLIPSLGIEGAALSTLVTQSVTYFLMQKKLRSVVPFSAWRSVGRALRVLQ